MYDHGNTKKPKAFNTPAFRDKIAYICAFHFSVNAFNLEFLKSSFVSELFAAHGIDFHLPSAETVTNQQAKLFARSQDALKKRYKKECLQGSLTFDGWSSALRKFNGITFHYLSPDFQEQCQVIGFVEYKDQSTADVISHQIGKPPCYP
jgi:hypothetical protein